MVLVQPGVHPLAEDSFLSGKNMKPREENQEMERPDAEPDKLLWWNKKH